MDNFFAKMTSHGISCKHGKDDSFFLSVSKFINKHYPDPPPILSIVSLKRKREEENNSSVSDSSMKLFFEACRETFCESVLENFQRHESKISKIVLNDRIEAYILPENITCWPSFLCSKQRSEGCPEFYFKRTTFSNLPRFEETVRLLRIKKQVISTGLSGIGKSAEVNGLLMEFLFHMGEDGWPKEAWYRYD
jgi:hypothetical protein